VVHYIEIKDIYKRLKKIIFRSVTWPIGRVI